MTEQTNTRCLLAEFLLATPGRASVAARSLEANQAWRPVLEMARQWKVLPHLFARLQCAAVQLTRADNATLRRELLHVYGFSSLRAAKALAAIGLLERAGICVIAFKGIASIALIYRDPRRRTIQDADLLVRRGDLFKAV